LGRDVAYMLGGTLVIGSFLFLYQKTVHFGQWSTPLYLLGAGYAWIIGYTVQEFFSLIFLGTTAAHFKAPWIVRKLYPLFTRKPWKDVPEFDHMEVRIRIYDSGKDRLIAYLERIATLRLVGTCVGPCALVSGFLLLVIDFGLAVADIAFGIVLLLLGWVKGADQMKYMHDLNESLRRESSSEPRELSPEQT